LSPVRPDDSFELARFKTDIHLVEYACVRHGYQRDKRESSRASHVLRHPTTDDKVVVGRDTDGHWTYFSVRDSRDNGTIVDFVQHRGTRSLGEARAELRDWLGTPRPDPGPDLRPVAVAAPRDRLAITAYVAQLPEVRNSLYLNARGIRPETLQDPRFSSTWTMALGNTIFLHRDADGVTGFEIKHTGFTGFSKGGTKTAWTSTPSPRGDNVLVLTETAIDALSYAQLRVPTPDRTSFLSTAGAPSAAQLELLDKTLRALPDRSVVVAAFDRDPQGHTYAATVGELAAAHHGRGLRVERHTPPFAKDWNEQLQRVERDYIRSLPATVRALAPTKDMTR
jgi:hypothetical protein